MVVRDDVWAVTQANINWWDGDDHLKLTCVTAIREGLWGTNRLLQQAVHLRALRGPPPLIHLCKQAELLLLPGP
jgi:hypothetical protein